MKTLLAWSIILFVALWGALCTQMPPEAALCYAWVVIPVVLCIQPLLYYIWAPLVEACAPVCFCGGEPAADPAPAEGEKGVKLTAVPLPPGDCLLVRDEAYTAGYTEFEDSRLRKGTQMLLSWRYWYMSRRCGLTLLTRFSNPEDSSRTHEVNITSNDPDEYFHVITLEPGQRCYVTPADIVAVSGGVELHARWRLWLPAWCMGQIRAYVASGRGTVVVRAVGGITAGTLEPGQVTVRKLHSLICASQGVQLHVRRTETLIPYLLGKATLFDLRLQGHGSYCIRNTFSHSTAVGRLLGF